MSDFSQYRKDLLQDAFDKMLMQFYDKCTLKKFLAIFIGECQELHDAIIDMQEKRTIDTAEGVNLDALGRIVGEDRGIESYDDTRWFTFDKQNQAFDQAEMWCKYAPLTEFVESDDVTYRQNIRLKAMKNHTLTGSVPELVNFIEKSLGMYVGIQKVGPNKITFIVNSTATLIALKTLVEPMTNNQVDYSFRLPIPATVAIEEIILFSPQNFFIFDTDKRGFDLAPLAVGADFL